MEETQNFSSRFKNKTKPVAFISCQDIPKIVWEISKKLEMWLNKISRSQRVKESHLVSLPINKKIINAAKNTYVCLTMHHISAGSRIQIFFNQKLANCGTFVLYAWGLNAFPQVEQGFSTTTKQPTLTTSTSNTCTNMLCTPKVDLHHFLKSWTCSSLPALWTPQTFPQLALSPRLAPSLDASFCNHNLNAGLLVSSDGAIQKNKRKKKKIQLLDYAARSHTDRRLASMFLLRMLASWFMQVMWN